MLELSIEEKAVRYLMSKSTNEMYMLINNLEENYPKYEVIGKILLNKYYNFLPESIIIFFALRYDLTPPSIAHKEI